MRKKEIKNIISLGWVGRRVQQQEKNKKNSQRTHDWKLAQRTVEEVEHELGRKLTAREYMDFTQKRKNEMK